MPKKKQDAADWPSGLFREITLRRLLSFLLPPSCSTDDCFIFRTTPNCYCEMRGELRGKKEIGFDFQGTLFFVRSSKRKEKRRERLLREKREREREISFVIAIVGYKARI